MIYGTWVKGQLDDWLSGKTIKAMLVDATYVQAVDDVVSDITGSEVSGTGYTTGGVTVTTLLTTSIDVPTKEVRLLCDPVDFGAVVITGVAGIVFYAGTVPIAADLFTATDVDSTGTSFTYTAPTEGLAVMTIGTGVGDSTLGGTRPVVTPGTRFPGDPGTGSLYYGESVGGGDPTARETYAGTHMGCYRSYFQPSQISAQVTRATRDLAANRLPIISSKMPATWGEMASGSQDTWIDTLMTGFDGVTGPIWFCPHHEPYDNQDTGSGSGMTAADYKAMCVRFMARKAANVAIVPILQSAPFDATVGGHADLGDWFSSASHDIAGLDAYNHWSGVYTGSTLTGTVNRWRSSVEVFSVCDQVIWGKPIAIAEWGVRTDPRSPGKAAAWMTDARAYLAGRGDVVAMAYFDSGLNVNDGGTPWTLDDHGTERLVQFATDLNNPANASL